MIINGKDAAKYYSSHSKEQINTVLQTLQTFGFHRELELFLKNGLYKNKFKLEPRDSMERMLKPLNKLCPVCGAMKLRGTKIEGCETRATGRTWYEECIICQYYGEEFGGK
jgi:hypothetical protein